MNNRPALLPPEIALDLIEHSILPLTRKGVAEGNKIFGAAIVLKSDYSLVLAATNQETDNPLWHGEMQAIRELYLMPAHQRPLPQDCYFLATHEPCSLCLSAISWGGYDNFTFLFSHEDSRDSFAIPHDLKILKEVFGLNAGEYRRHNAFWQSSSIAAQIKDFPLVESMPLQQKITHIHQQYAQLSDRYQHNKSDNTIPLN